MRKRILYLVVSLALALLFAGPVSGDPGTTRFEYYVTNADTVGVWSGAAWGGQSFTPLVAHTITSVRLLVYRVGSPGDLTISIRATDGSGHPTGDDLCVGVTDGDTLTTNGAGEWREITLGDGHDLSANVKYAIVFRVESLSDTVNWLEDETAGEYPGGCVQESINSGVDWDFFTYPDCDFMFEEYGRVITAPPVIVAILRSTLPFAVALGIIITGFGLFRGNLMIIAAGIITGVVGFFLIQAILAIL